MNVIAPPASVVWFPGDGPRDEEAGDVVVLVHEGDVGRIDPRPPRILRDRLGEHDRVGRVAVCRVVVHPRHDDGLRRRPVRAREDELGLVRLALRRLGRRDGDRDVGGRLRADPDGEARLAAGLRRLVARRGLRHLEVGDVVVRVRRDERLRLDAGPRRVIRGRRPEGDLDRPVTIGDDVVVADERDRVRPVPVVRAERERGRLRLDLRRVLRRDGHDDGRKRLRRERHVDRRATAGYPLHAPAHNDARPCPCPCPYLGPPAPRNLERSRDFSSVQRGSGWPERAGAKVPPIA